MTLPVVFTANGPSGYNLTNSLRFRSSASAYLNRTPASAGNRRTWTWSGWVKRGTLGVSQYFFSGGTGGSDTTQFGINFLADNKLNWLGGSGTQYRTTTQVFRDPSAWYHIVLAFDTTLATANDRIKIYVNGTQITAFDNLTNPTQNVDYGINQAEAHNIGRWTGASGYFDGYLTEINFIDGQALTPSSFGETSATTGVWQPIKYTGTYGTNGFYLPFTDNSALTTSSNAGLGKDFSGNANYWTTNNISITSGSTYDSMTDVPTLTSATAANYCVLSPIDTYDNPPTAGNLSRVGVGHSGSPWSTCRATLGVSTGKWYFEATLTGSSGSYQSNSMVGIITTTTSTLSDAYGGSTTRSYQANGNLQGDNSTGSASSAVSGDVIMCAFDIDAGKVWFGKNGTWFNSGVPASGTGNVFTSVPATPIAPQVSMYGNTGDNNGWFMNFGQRPFAYTPPTGFVALNTFNLPTPTIGATASTQANDYFNVVTYTGNGATYPSTQSITGVGFQPDFTWIKSRSNAYPNFAFDAVRGAGKELVTNDTAAETNKNQLSAFGSDGFSVAVATDGSLGTNGNGSTFVAWNWKANGSGSTNTAGSITSTVSANTTAGFSIATFTGNGTSGATIGHGLGVAPSMAIIKMRSALQNWTVYHASLGNTKALSLDLTDAASTTALFWNNTSPTSSLITLGSGNGVNKNTETYVAYCFAPIAGYSAFGSYTGNGSTDGTFVYTGFRPRFILIKASSFSTASTVWTLFDTSRSPYNASVNELYANSSSAEGVDASGIDILSNGFKPRRNSDYANSSGQTYIYMAFCESPFKYANAR